MKNEGFFLKKNHPKISVNFKFQILHIFFSSENKQSKDMLKPVHFTKLNRQPN